MSGPDFKNARKRANLTQVQAARRLGVTQAYLSMTESGERPLSGVLLKRARRVYGLGPAALPLDLPNSHRTMPRDFWAQALSGLGYPGFAHEKCRRGMQMNPAAFLLAALDQDELVARVVEALPWVPIRYADMDWDWLVAGAKAGDRQNRLGFVVGLAAELADAAPDEPAALRLRQECVKLEHSRLVREDTLCHEGMTSAERSWLREKRPALAAHWNLLTDLRTEHLQYASG